MTEKWRRYETLIIFDPEGGTEATDALIQRARDFVTQESGRILKTERWGLRDMAFEMKGRRKGYYLLLEYAGLSRAATELDRRLNMIDAVLKFQTIRLEEQVDPDSLPESEVFEPEQGESASGEGSKPAAAKEAEPDSEEDEGESDDEEDEG